MDFSWRQVAVAVTAVTGTVAIALFLTNQRSGRIGRKSSYKYEWYDDDTEDEDEDKHSRHLNKQNRGAPRSRDHLENIDRSTVHRSLMDPIEVLHELQKGNARFWSGAAKRPELNAFQRRALIMQQTPSIAVLGCADSRVPIEIVFDQGLGDIFVVRVAGNCVDTATSGSLSYAVKYLGVKVLLVMGHEGCGAIKAAQLPHDEINKESAHLASMLRSLKEGLTLPSLKLIRDSRAADREAVVCNVKIQAAKLLEDDDDVIAQKVRSKELIVVGAFYEISSGIVGDHSPSQPFTISVICAMPVLSL